MTTSRLMVALVIWTLGILGMGSPAGAQTAVPTFELSAAYQFTHSPDFNLPLGFAVDGSRNWGVFGLVGEVGWARKSEEALGVEAALSLWHFGAGPRWSGRASPRVTPYAQVLAGLAHLRAGVEAAGIEVSESESKFMLQPGGGVSVAAGDGWAIFGAVDYRRVFLGDDDDDNDDFDDDDDDGGDENEFRFLIGLRMLLD